VAPTATFAALEANPSTAASAVSAYGGNPAPAATAPTEPSIPMPGGKSLDWESVIEDLQGMADRALGARSRKVKDLLGSAERSQAGLEHAVSQVSQISLLFVDSALLMKLEQDMRARLQTYL
jgi:hypothetical protein